MSTDKLLASGEMQKPMPTVRKHVAVAGLVAIAFTVGIGVSWNRPTRTPEPAGFGVNLAEEESHEGHAHHSDGSEHVEDDSHHDHAAVAAVAYVPKCPAPLCDCQDGVSVTLKDDKGCDQCVCQKIEVLPVITDGALCPSALCLCPKGQTVIYDKDEHGCDHCECKSPTEDAYYYYKNDDAETEDAYYYYKNDNAEPSCEACPSGEYFDGCNKCRCKGGEAACTKMACLSKGTPECTGQAPPSCETCPSGHYFDGCNKCKCIDGKAACSKMACASKGEAKCDGPMISGGNDTQTEDAYYYYYDANAEPSCETCPSGHYFDGCNKCRCIDGKVACTKMACASNGEAKCDGPMISGGNDAQTEDAYYYYYYDENAEPSPALRKEICAEQLCLCPVGQAPVYSTNSTNPNGCKVCTCEVVPSCDTCAAGEYFDGCNTCKCKGGVAMCTRKLCTAKVMAAAKPECMEPQASCKTCPSKRYFDGCNHCTCDEKGEAACTEKMCMKKDPAQCTACPAPFCACPHDQVSVFFPGKDGCDTCKCEAVKLAPSCETCASKHYSDGCNICKCNDKGQAMCTMMACAITKEPKCLEMPALGGCAGTRHGCCPDGSTAKDDEKGKNCGPKCPTPLCWCPDGEEQVHEKNDKGCDTCKCEMKAKAYCGYKVISDSEDVCSGLAVGKKNRKSFDWCKNFCDTKGFCKFFSRDAKGSCRLFIKCKPLKKTGKVTVTYEKDKTAECKP